MFYQIKFIFVLAVELLHFLMVPCRSRKYMTIWPLTDVDWEAARMFLSSLNKGHQSSEVVSPFISFGKGPLFTSDHGPCSLPAVEMSPWLLLDLGKGSHLGMVLTTSSSGVPKGEGKYEHWHMSPRCFYCMTGQSLLYFFPCFSLSKVDDINAGRHRTLLSTYIKFGKHIRFAMNYWVSQSWHKGRGIPSKQKAG